MPAPSLADLPTASHDAVASAGYRLARWQAAREVLEHRVTKKRLPEALQAFLEKWMPNLEIASKALEVRFEGGEDEIWLFEGGLASSAAERALLHLPALRSFWAQELRQAHFEALRQSVPQAWFADDAVIPPGAVIAGLGVADWSQARDVVRQEKLFIRVKEASWTAKAVFHRNAKGQIVLRDWQGMP
ncbi:MAG: hypothetical protein ACK5TH_12440 [Prosthecobacter sp.]